MHHRQVVLAGLDRIGRVGREQLLDRHDPDAGVFQHRDGRHERVGDDDNPGIDHVDDRRGVLRPQQQVGARSGLVQHRDSGAAHPDTLRGRGDLDRGAGQHADRLAVSNPGGG